jgi:hypothetical protein
LPTLSEMTKTGCLIAVYFDSDSFEILNSMSRRAAIVIGIEAADKKPRIPAALADATEFSKWAKDSGLEVFLFLGDYDTPVRAESISECIDKLVSEGDIEKLFLYFSGHGLTLSPETDFILLSAGERESINLTNSLSYARKSGIPHIAIFADCCRTYSNDAHGFLKGNARTLFLETKPTTLHTEVDVFYSTKPSQVSLEVVGKKHGLFTASLLRALRGEETSVIRRASDSSKVVRACDLSDFLRSKIPDEARILGFEQEPVCYGGSQFSVATIAQARYASITIEVIHKSGQPAYNAKITLQRYDPTLPLLWEDVGSGKTYSLRQELPIGDMIRVLVTAPQSITTQIFEGPFQFDESKLLQVFLDPESR